LGGGANLIITNAFLRLYWYCARHIIECTSLRNTYVNATSKTRDSFKKHIIGRDLLAWHILIVNILTFLSTWTNR